MIPYSANHYKNKTKELHKYAYITSITAMRIQRQIQLAAKLGICWLRKKDCADRYYPNAIGRPCLWNHLQWHTEVHPANKVASFRFGSPPKAKLNAIILSSYLWSFQLGLWKIYLGSSSGTGKDSRFLENPHLLKISVVLWVSEIKEEGNGNWAELMD